MSRSHWTHQFIISRNPFLFLSRGIKHFASSFFGWLMEIFYGVKNAKRKYKMENIAKIVNGPSIDLEFFKQRGIYELRQMGDPSNFVSNSEASAEEAPIV